MGDTQKLDISKLVPQDDGHYAILINGRRFGVISAHPQANFVVGDNVYKAGTHIHDFNGKKLKIEVKDFDTPFHPEWQGETHMAPGRTMEDKLAYIEKNKEKNEKARAILLNRVVVTEA